MPIGTANGSGAEQGKGEQGRAEQGRARSKALAETRPTEGVPTYSRLAPEVAYLPGGRTPSSSEVTLLLPRDPRGRRLEETGSVRSGRCSTTTLQFERSEGKLPSSVSILRAHEP